jgi:hypothetical protein
VGPHKEATKAPDPETALILFLSVRKCHWGVRQGPQYDGERELEGEAATQFDYRVYNRFSHRSRQRGSLPLPQYDQQIPPFIIIRTGDRSPLWPTLSFDALWVLPRERDLLVSKSGSIYCMR